jgi:cellulose synthase (UDP-forming)
VSAPGSAGPRRLQRAAGQAAALTGLVYLQWRFRSWAELSGLGVAFLVIEVVSYGTLLLTVAVTARRRHRPDPVVGSFDGSLDVFVTVCGEPLDMVEQTLRAAIALDQPHRTFLLDDSRRTGRGDPEAVAAVAARLGVPQFCRSTGALGKAGNLNHALRRTCGDVVLTLDADHLVAPDAAEHGLPAFADPQVGFVCTRQRFDVPDDDPLYNDETFFYEVLQPAKDADSSAISCGNGTFYRRAALDGIGGFSEWNLVEDLHTSYLLHAAGWRSRYLDRSITVGTAPMTPGVYLSQRLRWATDSTRLLLHDNPLLRPGLTGWQRLHYLHTTSYYLLASLQVVFLLGPPLYVLLRASVVPAPSLAGYLLHHLPYLATMLWFLAAHVGLRAALRGVRSGMFCLPVYVLSTLRLAAGRLPPSAPTEKGHQRWFAAPVLPVLAAAALLCATVLAGLLDRRPDASPVALAWAVFLAAMVTAPLTAGIPFPALRSTARRALAVACCLAAATPVLVPAPAPDCRPVPDAPAGARDVVAAPVAAPVSGAYLGSLRPDVQRCAGVMQAAAEEYGGALAIAGWFQQWDGDRDGFRADWASAVAGAGAVPLVVWEPWRKPRGAYSAPRQPAYTLESIAAGDHDDYVTRFAQQVAAYGRPVMLRLMQEMNGTWYPWSIVENGGSPAAFVRAWRHVHELFDSAGALNVTWVWTINRIDGLSDVQRDVTAAYPGDAYVDWVAMTGFDWGETLHRSRWRSPVEVLDASYAALVPFGKPVMVAELGTVRQKEAAGRWVREAVDVLMESYGEVGAVVWLDRRYGAEQDFRLGDPALDALDSGASYWRPLILPPGS